MTEGRFLDGKQALVTGGSSGIGEAVAAALHHSGCRVLATALTALERCPVRAVVQCFVQGPAQAVESLFELMQVDSGERLHGADERLELSGGFDLPRQELKILHGTPPLWV